MREDDLSDAEHDKESDSFLCKHHDVLRVALVGTVDPKDRLGRRNPLTNAPFIVHLQREVSCEQILQETLTTHKGEAGLYPCEVRLHDGADHGDDDVEPEEATELCSLACGQKLSECILNGPQGYGIHCHYGVRNTIKAIQP